MSELRIDTEEFPRALPVEARVGDEVTLRVRGTVNNIGAEIIDVSSYSGKAFMAGGIRISVLVSDIAPLVSAERAARLQHEWTKPQ